MSSTLVRGGGEGRPDAAGKTFEFDRAAHAAPLRKSPGITKVDGIGCETAAAEREKLGWLTFPHLDRFVKTEI
ncbi:hypothetical protein Rcae01_01585 [Novipirellula caenicola]|uniref:Uncharacterized protein n=1 Tax=Novipirellula caenicola TaxID=1536901 RepID=A0ABP9VLQ1_9BACT